MEEKESLQSTEEPSQHLDWGTAVEMEADAVVSPFPPSVQRLSGMDLGANKSPDMEITKQKSPADSRASLPLDEKEQKMYFLGREKQALNKKAERLRRELAEVREEKMGLIADLSSSAKMERNASLKIQELEEALKNETKTRVEIETHLARRDEEMSQLQNALAQAEKNLEKSQRQW
ncbi:myosin-4-like [Lates japonicus]